MVLWRIPVVKPLLPSLSGHIYFLGHNLGFILFINHVFQPFWPLDIAQGKKKNYRWSDQISLMKYRQNYIRFRQIQRKDNPSISTIYLNF